MYKNRVESRPMFEPDYNMELVTSKRGLAPIFQVHAANCPPFVINFGGEGEMRKNYRS